ncbi:response regulator [bacterium]|nr:response regulator [bacterium]
MNKILLVDDAQTVLLLEKMILSPHDFILSTASNGLEAIQKIEKDRPDLILLDLNMPVMNGLECCRSIKSNSGTLNIPIIMVTTVSEADRMNECIEAGCDDYIFKPFRKIDLLTKINQQLHPNK